MRKPEFSLAPILILTSVAWFTTSGAQAPTIADPPGTTVSGPADVSTAEKAVAARKERCRLHPGTCKRGQQKPEPPKPFRARLNLPDPGSLRSLATPHPLTKP